MLFRSQALESVLEIPRPLLKFVRVPFEMPAGPVATNKLDPELISRGLMIAKPAPGTDGEDEEDYEPDPFEDRPPTFAEKLRMLFDATYPEMADLNTQAVWAAGELLRFGGNFNSFVTTRDLTKQEGIIFRHLLRLILLLEEFEQLTPEGVEPAEWKARLHAIGDKLTASCRAVDQTSTEETIQRAHAAADVVEGEEHATPVPATEVIIPPTPPEPEEEQAFGAGIVD